MQQAIESLRQQFNSEIYRAQRSTEVEALRVKYLGKKSPLQALMKALRDAEGDARREMGKEINDLKDEITAAIETARQVAGARELQEQLTQEQVDATLPGRRRRQGRKHPISESIDEIIAILKGMGFSVQYGPDIESDYYNFEALNFADDHPARDMQDTFYIAPHLLLRTHCTNVQARVIEQHAPPLRIIAPGKVYRNESISARSHVVFHQVDGVYIDKKVTFADLLAMLKEFYSKLFSPDLPIRFRPSYFPFVEPGVEVDIGCLNCKGSGCGLCKFTGWLEVCGAGMVHPEVLKCGGIDPEVHSGFAWGMGVERPLLLKHGIKDIRIFMENDLRFLQQFSGV